MLELEKLSVALDGAPILESLDLTIAAGEFVVVLGASGCGKTTLLRTVAGLAAVRSGRLRNRFRRFAFVFQEPRLLPWADALDNAAFGLKALGVGAGERRRRVGALLLRLGLGEADFGKRPAALSGGMRQRVALARALAIEPDLLLLDEPFSALDFGLRRSLQDLLSAEVAGRGAAAVFVTHDPLEAVRLATRILVLSPRPARIVADIANTPERDPARAFERASQLLRIAEIAAALLRADAVGA